MSATPSIVLKYTALYAATQISSTRACDFCRHGQGLEGLRDCMHPDLKRRPVEMVRGEGGMCGPEARLFSQVEETRHGVSAA